MAKSRRHAQLARIHIGAKEIGLIEDGDDSAYRDMLWSIARVRSAADLDLAGRSKVLDHLKRCGFRPSISRGRARYSSGDQPALIRLLWRRLKDAGALRDPSERALRRFIKRQSQPYHPHRAGYDAPEMLPTEAAQAVIEHLKKWCHRHGVGKKA